MKDGAVADDAAGKAVADDAALQGVVVLLLSRSGNESACEEHKHKDGHEQHSRIKVKFVPEHQHKGEVGVTEWRCGCIITR